MPSKSFRKDISLPPIRYRTPSPPRHVIEPISPILTAFKEPDGHRPSTEQSFIGLEKPEYAASHATENTNGQENGVQGPMDAFASIALATNNANGIQNYPQSLNHPFKEPPPAGEAYGAERPSKRARSEKLQSSEWPRDRTDASARPTTSHGQSFDSRTLEAELLLNFSQKARAVSSRIYSHQSDLESPYGNLGTALRSPVQQKSSLPNTNGQNSRGLEIVSAVNLPCEADIGIQGTSAVIPQPLGPNPENHDPPERIDGQILQDGDVKGGFTEGSLLVEKQDVDNTEGKDTVNCAISTLAKAPSDGTLQAVSSTLSHNRNPLSPANDNLQDQSQEDNPHGTSLADLEGGIATQAKNPTALGENPHINVDQKMRQAEAPATCSACHFSRNSSSIENENNSTSWISCDGCKSWFHFACAGFKSEREVRSVDKYRCRKCRPEHGNTTYVRKSGRAHSAIDYAGLNQGVIKTSDETQEHHYIKPIKDGVISFLPENFARMSPDLVTAEFFENGSGMKEPIVIPASLNPQPQAIGSEDPAYPHQEEAQNPSVVEEWLARDAGLQKVIDHGQDALDMVMPQNLTVRIVSELYGPEERVEVIDVKSQNGEGKKWNMRRWADYYETKESKVVRNVISLEVSQSKLGRLIRRPKIVRDLDLQDSVWPQELQQKGEIPRVQLYCLMSVADCFTDFHIDFGGSSVFYHILKGKKTFLFIPPKEKHLKKYEEWCQSPAQNWTFLADQTKECYRVDLSEGDTMLIPAGWIHAVWTPEDSLVIGGNFLTRMHYGMQFRIAQIEKATGVGRKFRYPHFQKLHWYVAISYLEKDPLPDSVRKVLEDGGTFYREKPAYYDFGHLAEKFEFGSENYNARYYSQAELEGLPDLTRYLLRTALIDHGAISEGISVETRNAVKKAIPRGFGEPLDLVKEFARWCAWKRGNEQIPHWAYPHAVFGDGASEKSSAAALKKMDNEAALQAPRRQSARKQAQQISEASRTVLEQPSGPSIDNETQPTKQPPPTSPATPSKKRFGDPISPECLARVPIDASNKRRKTSGTLVSNRRPACESCRKRRRACKHRDEMNSNPSGGQTSVLLGDKSEDKQVSLVDSDVNGENAWISHSTALRVGNSSATSKTNNAENTSKRAPSSSVPIAPIQKAQSTVAKGFESISGNAVYSRGRSKACNDCRKSKVRVLLGLYLKIEC